MVKKKPITPSVKELQENMPSRSAKLRYIIKKEDFFNFETDILKRFENLIEIENFGKNYEKIFSHFLNFIFNFLHSICQKLYQENG